MLTNRARYIVIALFLILAIAAGIYHVYEIAAIAVLFALFVLWGYFKDGAIVLAARAYHEKNWVKTALLLGNTANPDYLARKRRGYYEFMKANLALQENDIQQAERHFQIATIFPLQKIQRISTYANLANLALMQKDAERTDAYIAQARKLEPTAKFTAILDRLEKERRHLKKTGENSSPAAQNS
ncbi:MAG: hypothetical protein INR69_00270 [Mucilaginibacter polytrichastri]|nr:hypothetical protein [Mucilaginibacter polytrichastri]